MEKVDVLVKGVPVAIHNMFKGICSLSAQSVSEGIIDAMIAVIEQQSGGSGSKLKTIVDEYQMATKQR